MAKEDNVLTEDFLFELYYACFAYDYVCNLVCEHMQKSYLPGRDFQALHECSVQILRRTQIIPYP